MDHQGEVDLKDLLYLVIKGWKVILASLCFCLFLAFAYSNLPISGDINYETNASMVINSKTVSVIDGEVEFSANNVYLSQKMVNTYRVILLSDNVLEKVSLDLGIDTPPTLIRSWMTVSSPKDTEVIMVSVKNQDPQLAADIANAIMRVAPQVIRETVEVGSINVLDEAKVSKFPQIGRKNSPLNMAIGGMLGLMLGGIIVFALNFLRPKLKNKLEMKEMLSLNCLGEIPHVKNMFNKLVTNKFLDPSFIEGYKVLTEMVIHTSEQSNIKTLIVTSAVSGEGKTTVAVNLALSMRLADKKTLLIDFDCYKKGVKGLFWLKPDKYLIDILNGDLHYSQGVIEDPLTDLHLILSDKGRFFGMDVLNSPKMKEVFENIKNDYDYIIIDTPPALIQSEAVSLSKYTDGVLLVAKQETASISDILETKDKINDVGAKIIGCVLNDIRYLVGTDYSNKYAYSKKYYYDDNKKTNQKEYLWKKTITSVLFLLMVFFISYFATRTGEQIIQMSDNSMNYIFSKMEQFGFLEDTIQVFDGKTSDEMTGHGAEIGYWAKAMEHWIHSIFFFILTIVTMSLLGAYRVRAFYSVIITLALFAFLAVGNEYYQSLYIEGRQYEFRDVVFSMVGMTVGFATYGIYRLMPPIKSLKLKSRINDLKLNHLKKPSTKKGGKKSLDG